VAESGASSPFYEDFRAEAADILSQVHRLLGGFRGAKGISQRDLVSALLRQFHTLKGLTGMVGLKRAGHLTHLVESYLLRLQSASGGLPEQSLLHVAAATRDLEQVIAAPDSLPDVLDRYSRLFEPSSNPGEPEPAISADDVAGSQACLEKLPLEVASALSVADRQLLLEGIADGRGLVMVSFASSPERAERGVKVNDVREALGERAEVLKVVPQISGRDVRFVFLLLTEGDFDCSDLEVERLDLAVPGQSGSRSRRAEDSTPMAPASLRVGTERLEEVVRLVENLVVSRYRLEQRISENSLPPQAATSLRETASQMQRDLRDLTEALMRVRMVPLSDVLQRLPMLTRELAQDSGKQLELVLKGEETRVDKQVVERLLDPLLHLVRNAVAHGIEAPAERARLGKNPTGRISIEAKPDGNSILITVADDGRGLRSEQIFGLARSKGIAFRPEDPQALLDVLCQPGFSTREEAGFDAGRGVGMEIVRNAVEAVGGSIKLRNDPGQGVTFWLRLPLTTAIVDALLVETAGQTFAIPTQELQEVVELAELSRVSLPSSELLRHRGDALPLYQLPRLLSMAQSGDGRLGLIYGSGTGAAAFAVDRVTGLREVVVRTFHDPLVVRPWFLGATELGDGRLVLILHLPELLRRAA
jgi:two-component system chemotaxis sensor kinase CheA